MFEHFLTVAAVVIFAAPVVLIAASCLWTARQGRTLPGARRLAFGLGLIASTVSYASHYGLKWYLKNAHFDFWREVQIIGRVGDLMILVAIGAFVLSWLGKGYGRITASVASLLIVASWFVTQVASF